MIPDWLHQKLASPPKAGSGVNVWLFTVGRQLHVHMDHATMHATLRRAVANCGRPVSDQEIRRAIIRSDEVAWTRAPEGGRKTPASSRRTVDTRRTERWPAVDAEIRAGEIREARLERRNTVFELSEASPVIMDGSMGCDDWLDWLFPSASFLCLAPDHPAAARSRPPEKWSFGPADRCGLVVPSPMTAASGLNLDGDRSHRCLGNTGPRRWLVIEFDDGTLDEQAALHWRLKAACELMHWPRLALVVRSGGKSLHGWYGLCRDEEQSRELMNWARVLGADTATWNRSQLVRLPGGLRGMAPACEFHLPEGWDQPGPGEIRQMAQYWDPEAVEGNAIL